MFKNSLKISKISYFLSLIVMITINSKAIAVEDLSFPFNSDSGKYWQYISDQVMGGVSDGEVTLEQDGEMYEAIYFKYLIYRSFISKYKTFNNVKKMPTQIVFYEEIRRGNSIEKVDININPQLKLVDCS